MIYRDIERVCVKKKKKKRKGGKEERKRKDEGRKVYERESS